jgi:hypothetical protein
VGLNISQPWQTILWISLQASVFATGGDIALPTPKTLVTVVQHDITVVHIRGIERQVAGQVCRTLQQSSCLPVRLEIVPAMVGEQNEIETRRSSGLSMDDRDRQVFISLPSSKARPWMPWFYPSMLRFERQAKPLSTLRRDMPVLQYFRFLTRG